MFVSRPQVFHGEDLRSSFRMTDARVRVKANLVASNSHTITTHTGDVTCVAFSRTTLATCSADKTVRLWNADDFNELACSPLLGHTYQIHCCAFSPLGSILATCSTDGTVHLWNIKSGDVSAVLKHPSKCAIRVCQFSADGSMLVTGGDDDLACLWNLSDSKLIRSVQGHDESVSAAAFTPDGNYVVTGSSGGEMGGELLVWDAKYGHGKYLARISECHDLGVTCCQFSPTQGMHSKYPGTNSRPEFLLATSGKDNLVKLWTCQCELGSVKVNIKLATMLPGHSDSVLWVSFSPDGLLLASVSLDKSARLWNVETRQTLLSLDSHTSYVSCCAFSRNNKFLATSSNDNTVKVWQLTDTSCIMDGLTGYEADVNDATDSPFSLVSMETWSVEDVCLWLEWLKLPEYEGVFRSNAIDGRELLALSASDLETSLGIAALGHRNKIMRARAQALQNPISSSTSEPSNTPEEFLCPISHEIMRDPVIASDGYTYDRPAIISWMSKGEQSRSPMTNIVLPSNNLTPNRTLKMMIQKFIQKP